MGYVFGIYVAVFPSVESQLKDTNAYQRQGK